MPGQRGRARPTIQGGLRMHRRQVLAFALAAHFAPTGHGMPVQLVVAAVNDSGGSQVAGKLLTEIYRRAGIDLKIQVLPSARAGLMAASGQLDGELIRVRNYGLDHPLLIRVDPAFYRVSVRAYTLVDRHIDIRSRADLMHYSIGAIRGMPYVKEFVGDHAQLSLTQRPVQMFRMLQAGRVDAVISTSISARSTIEQLQIGALVAASPELGTLDLHHYLHVKHASIAARVSELIQKMKSSGELDRLTQQFEQLAPLSEAD